MKLKTRAAHKELDHESTRLAACLCAAVDAAQQAEAYAKKKYAVLVPTVPPLSDNPGVFVELIPGDPSLRFSSDNICSMALSLYIRRRDESKPPQQWNRKAAEQPKNQ